ncbi:hypothetical protein HQQ81_13855 [Microbacteriaceae bacterium VKM Ac-2854]|nr:hypothetical protein [Microbacteriaceae bacterium VKM Ac-2854]
MATLIYGPQNLHVEFDERVLAHVKVAVLAKLRRSESFSLSWVEGESAGHGRSSIWLNPAVPLQFRFRERSRQRLNRAWVEEMLQSANLHGELTIGPEPAPAPEN